MDIVQSIRDILLILQRGVIVGMVTNILEKTHRLLPLWVRSLVLRLRCHQQLAVIRQ